MKKFRVNNHPRTLQGHKSQQGFVLTIELLLLVTILVIGSFVGIVAVRDALFKQKVKQLDNTIVVSDSNGTAMGEMVSLDEHDAPQLFFIDRTSTESEQNYRALIGVRDDRFTSREPIYYTQLNCQGDPCIKPVSTESMDDAGVSRLPATGAVSYFQALQGAPNYAIGRSPNGLPGNLFRETLQACELPELVGGVGSPIGSRYMSQKVVTGEPCDSPFDLPVPAGEVPMSCARQSNNNGNGNGGRLGVCDAGCGSDDKGRCACPAGYYEVQDSFLGLSDQCCPEGTDYTSAAGGGALCSGLGLRKAQSVVDINNPEQNALEQFDAPFSINLPAPGGRTEGDQWYSTPPDGEGNN
tara:strand:+ start:3139 stop:4200 length:1062 start_codon:yes stop_codon:yes gene_type:complete